MRGRSSWTRSFGERVPLAEAPARPVEVDRGVEVRVEHQQALVDGHRVRRLASSAAGEQAASASSEAAANSLITWRLPRASGRGPDNRS